MNEQFMQEAIALSEQSVVNEGYPVGAVVVLDGAVVGRGVSDGKRVCDATMHAEIAAIRDASTHLGKRNLEGAEIYTSMEPCVMCLMACYWAYIDKIYYAVSLEKLSNMHAEGDHDKVDLIKCMNRSPQFTHLDTCEESALKIVLNWEQS